MHTCAAVPSALASSESQRASTTDNLLLVQRGSGGVIRRCVQCCLGQDSTRTYVTFLVLVTFGPAPRKCILLPSTYVQSAPFFTCFVGFPSNADFFLSILGFTTWDDFSQCVMKPTLYFRPKCSVCFLLLVDDK